MGPPDRCAPVDPAPAPLGFPPAAAGLGRAGHYADVEHLGFAVTLDGYRIVHLGDGIIEEKALRAAGMLENPGDVGVVPFWYLTYPFVDRSRRADGSAVALSCRGRWFGG